MKKNIIYIISNINKALAFEWIAEQLNKENFELSFILLNNGNSELEKYLVEKKISVTRIQLNGKKSWPLAFFKLVGFFKKHKPDIIHCHLLDASILGLLAGKLAGIKKRIYTRHHSSQHHVYHRKGVFWDKLCNHLATDIVAITEKVKEILINWEKANLKKIIVINHGFKLARFEKKEDELVELKEKYNEGNHFPVIGVISRFTEYKGIQFIIPAFQTLLMNFPNAKLLLLNANGDFKEEIKELLVKMPDSSYQLIPFEKNIFQMYHLFDVFVHVPIDNHSEAFGQTYVEALAAGIPSVFTLSGIANEFIVNGENALVVPYKDADAIYNGINKILFNDLLKKQLKDNGLNSIKRFSLHQFITRLEELYEG